MKNSSYQSLPTPPEHISAAAVLARLVDAIGFRYQLATADLTSNEINFRPVEGSMNMLELIDHIYKVLSWGHSAFDKNAIRQTNLKSFEDYRDATLQVCENFKTMLLQMTDEEVAQVSIHLKRNDTDYSFWYLINGPIADVLTHIGQIASWRRIAGNPIARISPFTGEGY